MFLRILVRVLVLMATVGCGTAAAERPAEPGGGGYAGLAASVEGYAESDHNSYSAARSLVLGWHSVAPDARARRGRTDGHVQVLYSVEEQAEKSDFERFRDSNQWLVDLVHPLGRLSDGPRPWLVSVWAWLEGAENHQQLQEREYMVALGPGLDRRLGREVRWDLRAGLALACNEEEKDDDWPRENFDIGRDHLNRRGCGYFARWNNQLHMSTGTTLGLNLDYYHGQFAYADQRYRRARVELYLQVPLVSSRHQLRVAGRTIRRHAELDLTGFEDRLNQAGIIYRYRF